MLLRRNFVRRTPPGEARKSDAVLIAGLSGFLLPFLLYGVGLLAPDFYDAGILTLYHRMILPLIPFALVFLAVTLVYFLDKENTSLLAGLSAVLGFGSGVFLLQDWWYFLPVSFILAVPFFLWYCRRRFWNHDWFATLTTVTLACILTLATVFSGLGLDERFGVGVGTIPSKALALGYLAGVVGILVLWGVFFGLRQRSRRRSLIASLIERFPRGELYFDEILSVTKRVCGEDRIERLASCVSERNFHDAGPLWPKAILPPGQTSGRIEFDLPLHSTRVPGVRKLAIMFRPALTCAQINSRFFLSSLDQALERDRSGFWGALISHHLPEEKITVRENRTVSLRLVKGDGPRELLIHGETLIGRHPELANPIPESEAGVSKMHCTLTIQENGVEVRDHSTNGTRVNGVSLTGNSCVARDGHLLGLGSLEYRLFDIVEKVTIKEEQECAQLAELVRQPESERLENHRRADAHFTRYLLLSEARAEALYYFGVNARNPEFEIPEEVTESNLWRERIETLIAIADERSDAITLPTPELSPFANWQEVHYIYENLWVENIFRLFITKGRQAPSVLGKLPGDLHPDPVDIRRLTGNLLLLRAQTAVSPTSPAQAAADLSLLLWLIQEEQTAKRVASAINDFFLRTIKRYQRGGEQAIKEENWPDIAKAALPYLLWTISSGDSIRGDRIYNVFGPIHGHYWGPVGNAFSMAFGALSELNPDADWNDLDFQGKVQSFVSDAASAFDEIEPKGTGRFLKLAFLVHVLRLAPE